MPEPAVPVNRAWLAPICENPAGLTMFSLVFALLLFSRKPDVLLHAELWGDDGWSWYPDAYMLGWQSLLLPVSGYLNTLQRLAGMAVQPFPLAWVPTLFALAGLTIQVLPAVFLASSRMRNVIPSAGTRILLAFLFVAMPNMIELYASLTNAQWNMALLAFLILVASPAHRRAVLVFDVCVLLISGLSGPFSLLLLPIVAWQVFERRRRADMAYAAIVCTTAAVQLCFLLCSPHGGRSQAPLGESIIAFARIISAQIVLGVELGSRIANLLPKMAFWQSNVWPVLVTLCAAVLCVPALARGTAVLRKFTLFAALVLAGALLSPQVSLTEPQWTMMAQPPLGNRYFAFPMLAWVGMLAILCADSHRVLRGLGLALAGVLLIWGIPHDWAEVQFPRTDFVTRAQAFAAAAPGTRMEFPVVPPGLSTMVLVKKKR